VLERLVLLGGRAGGKSRRTNGESGGKSTCAAAPSLRASHLTDANECARCRSPPARSRARRLGSSARTRPDFSLAQIAASVRTARQSIVIAKTRYGGHKIRRLFLPPPPPRAPRRRARSRLEVVLVDQVLLVDAAVHPLGRHEAAVLGPAQSVQPRVSSARARATGERRSRTHLFVRRTSST